MKEQANKIRAGWIIEHNNKQYSVMKSNVVSLGNWRSFVQVEMRDIASGNKTNERFSTADMVEKLSTDTQDCQYLYKEGENLIFMNKETYDQIGIPAEMLAEQAPYLQDNMDVKVNFIEGKPVGIDLPKHVVLEVKETEPYMKGQTATTSYKPAIMENGVRVMIPPFVTSGEKIVVSTEDSTYVERAK